MSRSVSVVICAHADERRQRLAAALASVLGQSPAPDEVIAVIDHNAGLQAAIAGAFPAVRTIPNEGPKGLSGARNTGIRHARGDIVAFLDDDAEADASWIARMVPHYADPAVLGVGGLVVPAWPADRPRWFPEEFDWVVGCSYRGLPTRTAPVRNVLGCNMSFRRDLLAAIGGFATALGRQGQDGAGCEETDLCIRALQAFPGSRILFDPAMTVRHHVTAARTAWRYFRDRCRAEGRSKALMVGRVGSGDGLASERSYVRRTLPLGVARGVGRAFRGDLAGVGRAAAIVAGFGLTAASYQGARLRSRRRAAPAPPAPVRIVDLDLGQPLPDLAARDGDKLYGAAWCLVRRDGRPVGTAEIPLQEDGLTADRLGFWVARAAQRADQAAAPAVPAARPDLETTVIVATHDRPERLAACLDTLLAQDYGPFDVVVVDNAPTSDATRQLVETRYGGSGRVRYCREDRPGLGHAHNRGVALATAPVLAFTDDDVLVDRGWLAALAGAFAAGPAVGCVTGLILPAELETRPQYWTECHGGFGKGFARRVFDLGANRPSDPLFPFTAGQFGSGANMAFRRDALLAVGGFDAALGAGTIARGGDDLAAFAAIVRGGYQLVYEPGALVWHYHRRDESGMRRQAYGYGVGLGAYLTKLVLDEPAVALRLARALPAGLAHMFGPSAAKNRRLPDDYPRALVWRERLGILAGIPAYLRSRAALRRPWPASAGTIAAGNP